MKRIRSRASGFSLIEVAISVVILFIAISGTMHFDNFAFLDIYRSQTKVDASMVGTMLMQSWRGHGATTSFDPVTDLTSAILDCDSIDLRYAWFGPGIPPGFYLAWESRPYYRVTINNVVYRVALSYDYIDGRKFLNVRVAWPTSPDQSFFDSYAYLGITESMN